MIILLFILLIIIFFLDKNKEKFNENEIDINNIKNLTKKISISRPIESDNLKKVKQIILEELKKIGLSVEEQRFFKDNHHFSNIIGINKLNKDNEKTKYILLSAHIDSIKDIEGAIDSATSIAIIINISKKLLENNNKYPLLIVFFDGEEAVDGKWSENNTLYGSKYFVENLQYNIDTAYILDLIGGDFKNKIACFSNNLKSKDIIKKLYKLNKKYENKIFENPDEYITYNIIEDDHIPFKNNNINYVHLIPYIFPINHHTIDDNYSNIDWNYIYIFYNILYQYLNN
jgi:glutaminyl-peptide cyclotransferase